MELVDRYLMNMSHWNPPTILEDFFFKPHFTGEETKAQFSDIFAQEKMISRTEGPIPDSQPHSSHIVKHCEPHVHTCPALSLPFAQAAHSSLTKTPWAEVCHPHVTGETTESMQNPQKPYLAFIISNTINTALQLLIFRPQEMSSLSAAWTWYPSPSSWQTFCLWSKALFITHLLVSLRTFFLWRLPFPHLKKMTSKCCHEDPLS